MGKWKQVGGDMDWAGVGCVLAKDDKTYKQVELVRIEPWMEHDSSAIPTHGLYCRDATTVDYDDMAVDKPNVKSALRSVGMNEDEYEQLEPVYKAEIIASVHGYDESESTSDLAGALPVKDADIDEIEFFHGRKENLDKVKAAEDDMRREALDKCFKTSLDFGKMPGKKALDFAWGEGTRFFKIDDDEKAGLGYAKLYARIDDSRVDYRSGNWAIASADDFKEIVEALASAPTGEKFSHHDRAKMMHYLGHPEGLGEDRDEENERLSEMATEGAESAHQLATSMMENLGFSWR